MIKTAKYPDFKKLYDGNKVVPGLILFILVVAFPTIYTFAAGGDKAQPALAEVDKSECGGFEGECGCVESPEYMRAYHMDLLNVWRNEAIRNGRRIYISDRWGEKRPFEASLSNTCIACHESKVEFCDKCHTYAGVSPYCWSCHVIPGEK